MNQQQATTFNGKKGSFYREGPFQHETIRKRHTRGNVIVCYDDD